MRSATKAGVFFAALVGTVDGANPIRRVVTLLQKMQSKVQEEGKKEEDLYEKFQCYCKTGAGDLSASIDAAETKMSGDTSKLEEAEAKSAQLAKDIDQHKSDRDAAKDAVAQATSLRAKEASTFLKTSTDFKTNLAALGKAIVAIEDGASGSFLQTTAAAKLRELSIDMDMSSTDRDMISAFLSDRQGYAPRSGEIIGILKQMKDEMEKDLGDATGTEDQAIKDYDVLMAAKKKEIATNQKALEVKMERLGQTNVDIVNLKEGLDDTAKSMLDDKKFLANLDKSCATKKKEWEERSATRVQELSALADTIKLLNDDDALELFKKTLPTPSLLQVQMNSRVVMSQAIKVLKAGSHQKDPRVEAILLALTSKAGNFDKVLKMIDDMVALLGKEQVSDDEKKAFCESEIDATEDQLKELENSVSDLSKAIDETKEGIATLTSEIAALVAGVKALDKAVSEATETRQEENAEFKSTTAANKAAKDLMGVAKNRLMKFYNPSLYTPPAKTELSAEQRIAVNMGSEAAPTVAPSGISGTGITYLQSAPVLTQIQAHDSSDDSEAPAPPPETWGAYQKKGEEQSGVTAMMDLLIADLDKDMQEGAVEEKNAQEEYETFMEDSSEKRSQDSKSISDKESTKAELEARLEKLNEEHKSTSKQAYTTATALKDLHLECDWLLANFDARKTARVGEVDSLKKAKAILSGADYSLLQRSHKLRGAARL